MIKAFIDFSMLKIYPRVARIIKIRLIIEIGVRYLQKRFITLFCVSLGNVPLIHMIKKITIALFASNQNVCSKYIRKLKHLQLPIKIFEMYIPKGG